MKTKREKGEELFNIVLERFEQGEYKVEEKSQINQREYYTIYLWEVSVDGDTLSYQERVEMPGVLGIREHLRQTAFHYFAKTIARTVLSKGSRKKENKTAKWWEEVTKVVES